MHPLQELYKLQLSSESFPNLPSDAFPLMSLGSESSLNALLRNLGSAESATEAAATSEPQQPQEQHQQYPSPFPSQGEKTTTPSDHIMKQTSRPNDRFAAWLYNAQRMENPMLLASQDWSAYDHQNSLMLSSSTVDYGRIFDPLPPGQTAGGPRTDWLSMYAKSLPPPSMMIHSAAAANNNTTTSSAPTGVSPSPKQVSYAASPPSATLLPSKGRVYFEKRDCDIIMGRGGRAKKQAGNQRYLAYKESLVREYKVGTKKPDKDAFARKVLRHIQDNWNSRFIDCEQSIQGPMCWYEVDEAIALRKIKQALREYNTKEEREKRKARYK